MTFWYVALWAAFGLAVFSIAGAIWLDNKKLKSEERYRARRQEWEERRWDEMHDLCMAAIQAVGVQNED